VFVVNPKEKTVNQDKNPSPANQALLATCKERDAWAAQARDLQRRLHLAECDLDLRRAHQAQDVWYFQGDGEDYLESLAKRTAVVIHAADLRALIAQAVRDKLARTHDIDDICDTPAGYTNEESHAFMSGWNSRGSAMQGATSASSAPNAAALDAAPAPAGLLLLPARLTDSMSDAMANMGVKHREWCQDVWDVAIEAYQKDLGQSG
jgi:hypothetical protein